MNNSKALFNEFLKQIAIVDHSEEISSMAFLVFENLFGLSRTDIMADRNVVLTAEKSQRLNTIIAKIKTGEPIQYILGEAYFFGRKFKVNQAVLIPRPETEDLVRIIKNDLALTSGKKILDVGTGSGCIAITVALEIPGSEVYASDVSEEALQITRKNIVDLHAIVTTIRHDILKTEIPYQNLDLVVSNPPYITLQEKGAMMRNVVDHEPHLALFVPDDDPLVFYNAIGTKAKQALSVGGSLLMEINEQYGKEVAQLFKQLGYSAVSVIKDLSGKDRIVKANLS